MVEIGYGISHATDFLLRLWRGCSALAEWLSLEFTGIATSELKHKFEIIEMKVGEQLE